MENISYTRACVGPFLVHIKVAAFTESEKSSNTTDNRSFGRLLAGKMSSAANTTTVADDRQTVN